MSIWQFIATMAVAALGGWIGHKMRIPAGTLLGSLILTMLFNIFTGDAYLPSYSSVIVKLLVGVFLGSRFHQSDISQMKAIASAIVIMIFGLLTTNLLISLIIVFLFQADLVTILLATSPAGLQEMSLLATDLGIHTSVIVTMQTVRLFYAIAVIPMVIRAITTRQSVKQAVHFNKPQAVMHNKSALAPLYVSFAGLAGGLALHFLQIPLGALIGSMLSVMILSVKGLKVTIWPGIRFVIQTVSGAFIGATIGLESLRQLPTLFLPLLIMLLAYTLATIAVAWIVMRLAKIDLCTALFSCIPGGMSDMAMISAEMGAQTTIVASMHAARMVIVIGIYPLLLSLLR